VKKHLFSMVDGDPRSLGAAIAHRLAIAPALAEALVRQGAVQVSRKRITNAKAKLPIGTRVTVFLSEPSSDTPLAIVYRDDCLIVVDKPAGIPTQATPTESAGALDARVKRLNPEARPLHRLDRDASGLVLFGTTDRSRARLQEALTAGQIKREYVAMVAGRLEGGGSIEFKIGRDGRDPRKRVALPRSHPAGEVATSHYRVLESGEHQTRVALSLETGRTHQLRVHLSALGHPILGDCLYDGPPGPRLLLHAFELRLAHPESGRPLTLFAPPPASFRLLGDTG
jgi:23S rRNA pseudouridine1911/1915/1917 synthase